MAIERILIMEHNKNLSRATFLGMPQLTCGYDLKL